jgi:hypothetical protein
VKNVTVITNPLVLLVDRLASRSDAGEDLFSV